MLMGKGNVIVHYMIPQKIENQNEDDESEPKYRWVQCPDMPDGLLTEIDYDDEAPHKSPKNKGVPASGASGDWDGRGDESKETEGDE